MVTDELSSVAQSSRSTIHQANPMENSVTTRSPRFLFLLNNDYGELCLAMYFLQGRDLIDSSMLLLPPRLFAKNEGTLPVQTCEYACIEDVIRIVDATKPEIVFLFSGYILPLHEVISHEGMASLLQLLSDRNCKVATSDPFFGIFSRMDPASISAADALRMFETELLADQTWHYRLSMTFGNAQILKQFNTASQILKDTTHLYFTLPHPNAGSTEVMTDTVLFFNPSLICDESAPMSTEVLASADGDAAATEKPHWLFVLGSVDYELQTSYYTEEVFIDVLARKLDETLEAGRRAVFVAPNECVQKLANRAPVSARKDLLTFCAYEDFNALLLSAEYVFYWNLASYSIFLRVINGLPIFMFDEGHLERHVKPMRERLVSWFYQNWIPPLLNQQEMLDTEVLAELSKDCKQHTPKMLKNLKALPSPEQLIEEFLRR